ncbi:MAG: hypothetical protein H6Q32_1411 [Bacteroidetes bacterium]|nr:hypothetical protein [Bacteroidota bacterium]
MPSGFDVTKIFIYGFVLIFCAIGMFLLYGSIISFQNGETTDAALMLAGALAFGGFGLGVLAVTTFGSRKQAREAALRSAHPREPWLWRDDWAAGRIRSAGKVKAWSFWGFAILWNTISTPLLFFLPEEILEKENYGALVGLLFPLVGIGLVVVAARKSIQQWKYGDAQFHMERVPGCLGGDIVGNLLFPHGLTTAESVNVQLSCIQSVRRRTSKGTSTDEHVLWQTEQFTPRLTPGGQGSAQRAMVKFRVPFDASPTGDVDENTWISWRLEVTAAVPGVDFATDFEIPVFKTPASSPQITEEQIRSELVSEDTRTMLPNDHASVTVAPGIRGGTEFILKSQAGLSSTVPAFLIMLVFVGIAALLAFAGAPVIFPLVFGIFGCVVIFSLIFATFGESRIVVEEGQITVRNSLRGIMIGRPRHVPCAQVDKIGVKGESRAGKRGYFSITLTQKDGKATSPLQFLPDRRQADWLAEEVRKAMEPWRGR